MSPHEEQKWRDEVIKTLAVHSTEMGHLKELILQVGLDVKENTMVARNEVESRRLVCETMCNGRLKKLEKALFGNGDIGLMERVRTITGRQALAISGITFAATFVANIVIQKFWPGAPHIPSLPGAHP